MSHAGQDQPLNVLHHGVKRLAARWRICRKRSADLSRLNLRKHRERFDACLIVGDPVDHGMAMAAEFFGRHVKGFIVWLHGFLRISGHSDQKRVYSQIILAPV